MTPVTIGDIRGAAATIADAILPSPMILAPALSKICGCQLFLKLENMQPTGSFKERGALNKLMSLSPEQRRRGVIAASAGNHAQGVAYHAMRLSVPATIVMPRHTPFNKVERTESYGATIVLDGETVSESQTHATELAARDGLVLIHPYDDPYVIAGQGTIGVEMMDAVPDLDDIVVPIGGGGLISGIAIAAKAANPAIRLTGVEAALYSSMSDAIKGIERSYAGASVAEGIAVKTPGVLTRRIIEDLVDEIAVFDESALEQAVHALLMRQNILAEGAGAAGLAAILQNPQRFAGRRVGLVICGGNIDARVLSSILLRGLVREGRLVRFRVLIDDSPGALSRVTRVIGDEGGNIVEVSHHRLIFDIPVKRADLDLLVETRDNRHVRVIETALSNAGFEVQFSVKVD